MKYPTNVENHVKWLKSHYKSQIEGYEKNARMFKHLSYLQNPEGYPALAPLKIEIDCWLFNGRPKLDVTVKAFNEVLPLLEVLAGWGADFSSNPEYDDNPAGGNRYYHSDMVTVRAHLVEGDQDCRRVIVGYKEPKPPEPIYAFECGPAQELPPVADDPALPALPVDSDEIEE